MAPIAQSLPARRRSGPRPGDSRITKLWIKRLSDGKVVFTWDRGPDVPATDATAHAIVDYLCAGLAEYVYGE